MPTPSDFDDIVGSAPASSDQAVQDMTNTLDFASDKLTFLSDELRGVLEDYNPSDPQEKALVSAMLTDIDQQTTSIAAEMTAAMRLLTEQRDVIDALVQQRNELRQRLEAAYTEVEDAFQSGYEAGREDDGPDYSDGYQDGYDAALSSDMLALGDDAINEMAEDRAQGAIEAMDEEVQMLAAKLVKAEEELNALWALLTPAEREMLAARFAAQNRENAA